MATQWPICKIARPGDRGQARSYRDLYWLADLVGAGLPAMASLRSGGTTGGLEDREQARSYRGLWWLADLVGAGLPAMASLLSGGTTGVPADREQARSYRGLWWLADLVGAGLSAMVSLRSGGTTEVQRIASKLAPTGVCGGWRILWELACQRWHLCDRATSVKP